MLIDTDTISRWYVMNQGFKVYNECPKCGESHIEYHKARMVGYQGIAAKCIDCGKELPVRFKAVRKTREYILKAN
jgi:predicted RNA-binding Zn-ribbon protein involved in translation (DUF1610 family)